MRSSECSRVKLMNCCGCIDAQITDRYVTHRPQNTKNVNHTTRVTFKSWSHYITATRNRQCVSKYIRKIQ